MFRSLIAAASLSAAALVSPTSHAADLPLELIQLPEGFKIELFAEGLTNARSLARGAEGTIFVSTRAHGNVYAVQDTDGDHKADQTWTLAKGMNSPNGIAFRDGSLYVAEIDRILRWDNIEAKLDDPGEPTVVLEDLPAESHHGWKYLAFGPDAKLYFNVGAPCNICNKEEEEPRFATIMRVNPDGSDPEIYAHGVRNSVGITWHPDTNQMWFTDNGRDLLGDDRPNCELNTATEMGQHFGFPYCHHGELPDPEFAADRSCDEFVAPAQKLDPHVAPLGLKFYTGDQFPDEYDDQIFIAEHGSWNRSKGREIGYRITLVRLDDAGKATSYEDFATGWLHRTKAWGRPVDVLVQPDGSMLVSDDTAHVVYRISYGE